MKANETPNLAKSTHIAITTSDEWKKIPRRIPPAAPHPNEIMNDNLTPTAFIKNPLHTYATISAMADKEVLTKMLPGMYFRKKVIK